MCLRGNKEQTLIVTPLILTSQEVVEISSLLKDVFSNKAWKLLVRFTQPLNWELLELSTGITDLPWFMLLERFREWWWPGKTKIITIHLWSPSPSYSSINVPPVPQILPRLQKNKGPTPCSLSNKINNDSSVTMVRPVCFFSWWEGEALVTDVSTAVQATWCKGELAFMLAGWDPMVSQCRRRGHSFSLATIPLHPPTCCITASFHPALLCVPQQISPVYFLHWMVV